MAPYICQRCSQNLATTHVTIVSVGMPFEYHICASCEKAEQARHVVCCPSCGASLREIKKSGRFGCAMDYEIFREDIEIALEAYHGSKEHVGKIPFRNSFFA